MAGMIGSVAGLGMQAYGMSQQRKQAAQQRAFAMQMLHINKKISKVNEKQATLEYKRRNWEIFREQQRARSEALATTVNQGAAGKGSSALGGAYGQIAGQVGGEFLKNFQNWDTYQELQKLYNRLAEVQAAAGQAPQTPMQSFSAISGQLPRVFSAFGNLGMLGSNSQ